MSKQITKKRSLEIFILELKLGKKAGEICVFAFSFAKGILWRGQRRPFSVPKNTFWRVIGYLWEAKTGRNRRILGMFWTTYNFLKICKRREFLIIRGLQNCLKTRVFETEGEVGEFQMLIFDGFVKIFYQHQMANRTDEKARLESLVGSVYEQEGESDSLMKRSTHPSTAAWRLSASDSCLLMKLGVHP